MVERFTLRTEYNCVSPFFTQFIIVTIKRPRYTFSKWQDSAFFVKKNTISLQINLSAIFISFKAWMSRRNLNMKYIRYFFPGIYTITQSGFKCTIYLDCNNAKGRESLIF